MTLSHKKKICLVVTDAISFNHLCSGQLEYLKKNSNFDIHLICGGSSTELNILSSRNIGTVHSVGLVRQPSLLKDITALFKLLQIFNQEKFDLIHYSTPKALLLSSLASYFARAPIRIALFRGRAYENFKGMKRFLYSQLDRITCSISTKNLFISKSLLNSYINEGIVKEKKTEIIAFGSSNGVNTSQFSPYKKIQLLDLLNLKNQLTNNFICLTVGRFCIDKGSKDLELIINNTSTNVVYIIVGDAEDEESTLILERIKLIKGRVFHFSKVSNTSDFFRFSNLHIFLSKREGFGNVALEAASTNIPTLAYDVVGVRDSVTHGVTGQLFDCGDIESISNTINFYNSNPSKIKTDYPKARDHILSKFDQNIFWKTQLEFYYKILN